MQTGWGLVIGGATIAAAVVYHSHYSHHTAACAALWEAIDNKNVNAVYDRITDRSGSGRTAAQILDNVQSSTGVQVSDCWPR